MAGYSGTPLAKKLGIKEGALVSVLGSPPGFESLLDLPARVKLNRRLGTQQRDVILFFTKRRRDLERELPNLRARLAPACGLWVCWPKKGGKVPTDMTEDVVREVALPTGLVDNKVCAVDETWSALRLVIRKELR